MQFKISEENFIINSKHSFAKEGISMHSNKLSHVTLPKQSIKILALLCLKPVSHKTRLGTRFAYGILGYTRDDWYEYRAPTVPGD